jgi:hypothetical protein
MLVPNELRQSDNADDENCPKSQLAPILLSFGNIVHLSGALASSHQTDKENTDPTTKDLKACAPPPGSERPHKKGPDNGKAKPWDSDGESQQ